MHSLMFILNSIRNSQNESCIIEQERPLNVNHEAACFIGKTAGEVKSCGKLHNQVWPECGGGEESANFNE